MWVYLVDRKYIGSENRIEDILGLVKEYYNNQYEYKECEIETIDNIYMKLVNRNIGSIGLFYKYEDEGGVQEAMLGEIRG